MDSGFTLDANEQIIKRVRKHWIALAPVAVSFAVICLVVIAGSYAMARYKDSIHLSLALVAGLLALLLAVAVIMLLIGVWVYRRNFLLLTNMHLIRVEQEGLFTRNVSQLALSRVQDVSSSTPGFLATVLGFGNVTVETAGEEDNFVFVSVPHPALLADECLAAHDKYAAGAPSGTE